VRDRRAVNGDDQSASDDSPADRRRVVKQSSVNGPRNFTKSTGRTAAVAGGGPRSAADPRRAAPQTESAARDGGERLPAIAEGPPRCQHCEAMSAELERVRHEFDAERQQWLAEKRRVIAYQKLLQSKYVLLERHCARLDGASAGLADGPNHVESAACNVTPLSGDADPRGIWDSTHASPSMLLPKLVSFGQSIET